MLKIKETALSLVFFILISPAIQAQHLQVQDSLLLENAFKNKDSRPVETLLDSWSQADMAAIEIPATDTLGLINRIFEIFIDKFLQKKLAGYYSSYDPNPDGGRYPLSMCRFSIESAPFLLLQDTLQYTNVQSDITDEDFMNYIKWRTDDNGQMPATVTNEDELYEIDKSFTKSGYRKVACFPGKKFWKHVENSYGHKPLLYHSGTMRQKTLLQFIGYMAYRAIDEQSIPYKEREARAAFLNSILKFGDDLKVYVEGYRHPLKVAQMVFVKDKARALLKYQVGFCTYFAFFDLNRLNDPDYKPLSVYVSIE